MQRHSITITRASKKILLRVTYASGQRDRQVPERAVRQALALVFGISDVSNSGSSSFLQLEQGRPWNDRPRTEKTGAIIAGWIYLMAQEDPHLKQCAAPWTYHVYRESGEAEFTEMCEQLKLSATERAFLLIEAKKSV